MDINETLVELHQELMILILAVYKTFRINNTPDGINATAYLAPGGFYSHSYYTLRIHYLRHYCKTWL